MVRVSELAAEQGLPLTSSERRMLASQTLPNPAEQQFEKRVMTLISDVMRREPRPNAGRLDREFRLADTLKYVGEKRDWPYIAHLIDAVQKSDVPRRRWTRSEWFKDKSVLLTCALLLILGLAAIPLILSLLGVLR